MKILYFRPDTIDCTADPHVVNYGDIEEMLADVLMVLESDLIYAIESVAVHKDGEAILESDDYTMYEFISQGKKRAAGKDAEKHKVAGLFYYRDAKDEIKIPPGLTGYKYLLKLIEAEKLDLEEIDNISIGIDWRFSMSHSCSDYITIDPSEMSVDYSNQDDYIGMDGYEEHCIALSKLIGHHIEPSDRDW